MEPEPDDAVDDKLLCLAELLCLRTSEPVLDGRGPSEPRPPMLLLLSIVDVLVASIEALGLSKVVSGFVSSV